MSDPTPTPTPSNELQGAIDRVTGFLDAFPTRRRNDPSNVTEINTPRGRWTLLFADLRTLVAAANALQVLTGNRFERASRVVHDDDGDVEVSSVVKE